MVTLEKPELTLESTEVGTAASGMKVVSVLDTPWLRRRLRLIGVARPERLSNSGFGHYIGTDEESVLVRFPSLRGTITIEDKEYPKLTPHNWAGNNRSFFIAVDNHSKHRSRISSTRDIEIDETQIEKQDKIWAKRHEKQTVEAVTRRERHV